VRDLVESVIDGILQQEKMQQHAANQKKHRAIIKSRPAHTQPINQTRLHATGSQISVSHKDRNPALWKVSRQFEAIFVQQMMSEMRKTVHKSDFIPSGFAEEIHASMMDEAISQASVRHHSFGIADNIYRQLEASQSRSGQTGSKQPGPTGPIQNKSIQAISTSADTLQMKHDITLEAIKHAN